MVTQEWQLLGLAFVDNADVDPMNPSVVYTTRDKFAIDYTKPAGEQWTWLAHTVDRHAHPDDPRSADTHEFVSPRVVVLEGKRFLFVSGMYPSAPRFFRLEGDIAHPSTSIELSGWGRYVDADGDLWNATEKDGIKRYPFQGLDEQGDPQYGQPETQSMPGDFQSLQRAQYDAEADVMYLGGWTKGDPRPGGDDLEKLVGTGIAAYPGWSTGKREAAWVAELPFEREGSDIRTLYGQIGMTHAGEYLFTVEMGTSTVRAWSKRDGELVKQWEPGAEVGGFVGVVDIPDGITAAQLPDGTYSVFVEEDHAGKVLMYRIGEPDPSLLPDAPGPSTQQSADGSAANDETEAQEHDSSGERASGALEDADDDDGVIAELRRLLRELLGDDDEKAPHSQPISG